MLYQNSFTMNITYVLVTFLIAILCLQKNPITITKITVQDTVKNKRTILLLLLMGFILMWNKLELVIEEKWIQVADKSSYFFSWEGHSVEWIQDTFYHPFVTHYATFFYVFVLTATFVASVLIYSVNKETGVLHQFFYAMCCNYLFAIPFYLFLPVNEVWSVQEGVRFLIPDIFPQFESTYRNMSGINNCFPSLHTSLSFTVFLIALRGKNTLFKIITGISTVTIIFSIFYLGIHWITDSIGGILLAFTSVWIAKKLEQKYPIKVKEKSHSL